MLTLLDYLVIVFMALAALTLLSLCLMFLVRNKKAQRVFFYIVTALSVYVASIGFRIGFGLFEIQTAIAVLTALVSIAAFVLERVSKGNELLFKIAKIMSAAALVIGMLNAIL